MATRKDVAVALKEATTSYYLKKGFSCFEELGLTSWGKLRADVICLKLTGEIIISEVKSSTQDFNTDTKWENYLPYCNRMVFIFTYAVYEKLKDTDKVKAVKKLGVGILILDPATGYLKSVAPARFKKMKKKAKRLLTIRMAWRCGISKRTNRRKRVYIC